MTTDQVKYILFYHRPPQELSQCQGCRTPPCRLSGRKQCLSAVWGHRLVARWEHCRCRASWQDSQPCPSFFYFICLTRNFFSHSSRGYNSEIKVSIELVPTESCKDLYTWFIFFWPTHIIFPLYVFLCQNPPFYKNILHMLN